MMSSMLHAIAALWLASGPASATSLAQRIAQGRMFGLTASTLSLATAHAVWIVAAAVSDRDEPPSNGQSPFRVVPVGLTSSPVDALWLTAPVFATMVHQMCAPDLGLVAVLMAHTSGVVLGLSGLVNSPAISIWLCLIGITVGLATVLGLRVNSGALEVAEGDVWPWSRHRRRDIRHHHQLQQPVGLLDLAARIQIEPRGAWDPESEAASHEEAEPIDADDTLEIEHGAALHGRERPPSPDVPDDSASDRAAVAPAARQVPSGIDSDGGEIGPVLGQRRSGAAAAAHEESSDDSNERFAARRPEHDHHHHHHPRRAIKPVEVLLANYPKSTVRVWWRPEIATEP